MPIDRREDAGDFYQGGKVISTRPVATGGDVKHSDFAGLDVKTNTIPDLRDAVRELGRRLGATVVTALAACVAVAATVQTVPVNDLDFDANPSIVTNVVFDAPPDFSTNNAALVETIEATAPAPGNYAAVSNRAMHAVQTETDPVWNAEKGDYATVQALENGDIIVSQANAADHAVYASDASFATDANFAESANSAGYANNANNAGYAGYAETADAAEPGGELDTQLTSLSSRVSLASSSATNYTDSATNAIAARISTLSTNVYTKAETEAKIVELAPAPGNYAAVSNAAVHAAITNALQNVAIAGKASKSDVDPLLFAQYYPDGSVKSAAEFTLGIKYGTPDTVNRTITVNAFNNTDEPESDNSELAGRVVIPPFVDAQGNPYISDDGTRYKVVGMGGGAGMPYDLNNNLTAIIAPNTVANIGNGAFFECTALTSVSLPAVTTIGNSVFGQCSSLTSVDFGDTARTTVPSLDAYSFDDVPTSCKIIVPYTQYDAWIAAPVWRDLPQEFVRHAEKADKPATFTAGNLAEFDSNGNPTDSHKKPSDFANATSVYTKSEMDAQLGRRGVDIPAGSTDVDAHGCVHNAPVELGLGAKATVDLSGLSSNAIVRSVSTAIGPGSDASNPDNPSTQQGIAVGNQARAKGTNAIAIGAGVRHEDEDDLTGDNAYAGANEAIAGGYSAKATASQAVALGSRARAHAQGAWQLGEGMNSNRNTLAFRDYQLLGEDGQVPYERVACAVAQAGVEFEAAVSNAVRRILAGGNMTLVCDGSEGEQILEPKVAGLSEVQFLTNTNGVHEASTLGYLYPPPLSARNYDVLISEIPEPMWMGTNGWETVAQENRLLVGFTELPPQYDVSMHVDESCGFQRSGRTVSITNAPTVVKLREISTNKVLVVVKPYRLEDL